jgi:hypothetical protein
MKLREEIPPTIDPPGSLALVGYIVVAVSAALVGLFVCWFAHAMRHSG